MSQRRCAEMFRHGASWPQRQARQHAVPGASGGSAAWASRPASERRACRHWEERFAAFLPAPQATLLAVVSLFALVSLFASLLTLSAPAFAQGSAGQPEPTPAADAKPWSTVANNAQLKRLHELRARRRRQLERLTLQRRTIDRQLARLQTRLEETERERRIFSSDVRQNQQVRASMQRQRHRMQLVAAALRRRVRRRLRRLYKTYKMRAIMPLRPMRSAARLLRQARYEAVLARADLALFESYQTSQSELQTLQDRLTERTAQIAALRGKAADRLRELARLRAAKETVLVSLLDERAEMVAELQALEAARGQLAAALERQRQAERLRTPPSGPSGSTLDQSPKQSQTLPEKGGGTQQAMSDRQAKTSLAALKGQLPWPASGQLLKRPPSASPVSRGGGRSPRAAAQRPPAVRGSSGRGIRISVRPGTPIRSVASGEVLFAELLSGYGKLLIIHHGNSYYTLYGGVGKFLVTVGDRVRRLQQIALADAASTESSAKTSAKTSHGASATISFEIRYHGIPENPLRWLAKKPAS